MILKDGRMDQFVPVILIIPLSPTLQGANLLFYSGKANFEDKWKNRWLPPCTNDLIFWFHVGGEDFITTLEVLGQSWAMGRSPAGHSVQCGWEQLGQTKFDKRKLRLTTWVKMIIISITSYFWICTFGEQWENFAVFCVFLSLFAYFPGYWQIFPNMLFLISNKFITSYSYSFLFVIFKSCNDLNVQ